MLRIVENLTGIAGFYQFAKIHEYGVVGDALRLLQGVRHHDYRIVVLEFEKQFFDVPARERV
jgi:hypothetical protein